MVLHGEHVGGGVTGDRPAVSPLTLTAASPATVTRCIRRGRSA